MHVPHFAYPWPKDKKHGTSIRPIEQGANLWDKNICMYFVSMHFLKKKDTLCTGTSLPGLEIPDDSSSGIMHFLGMQFRWGSCRLLTGGLCHKRQARQEFICPVIRKLAIRSSHRNWQMEHCNVSLASFAHVWILDTHSNEVGLESWHSSPSSGWFRCS